MLSDPAIQSKDKELFKERTNLGQRGILAFYGSDTLHEKCNDICENLGIHTQRPDVDNSVEGIERSL